MELLCSAELMSSMKRFRNLIASPKGEHRRPPVPCVLRLGLEVFCLCRSLRYLQHGYAQLPLGYYNTFLEPFGAILEGLEPS